MIIIIINNNDAPKATNSGTPNFVVDGDWYDDLMSKIEPKLPTLPFDRQLTAKDIYGAQDWAELDAGTQKKVGLYVSLMVENKHIPLCCVPQKHGYPKLYVRT